MVISNRIVSICFRAAKGEIQINKLVVSVLQVRQHPQGQDSLDLRVIRFTGKLRP